MDEHKANEHRLINTLLNHKLISVSQDESKEETYLEFDNGLTVTLIDRKAGFKGWVIWDTEGSD